jgi:chromosome segregation ATPase
MPQHFKLIFFQNKTSKANSEQSSSDFESMLTMIREQNCPSLENGSISSLLNVHSKAMAKQAEIVRSPRNDQVLSSSSTDNQALKEKITALEKEMVSTKADLAEKEKENGSLWQEINRLKETSVSQTSKIEELKQLSVAKGTFLI